MSQWAIAYASPEAMLGQVYLEAMRLPLYPPNVISTLSGGTVQITIAECGCSADWPVTRSAPAQVVTLKSDIYSFGMLLWEVKRLCLRAHVVVRCHATVIPAAVQPAECNVVHRS